MLNIYRFERQVDARMREARVPGVAVAVVRGSDVAYAQGFGVTSVEDGALPVTPTTVFHIWSTTKTLTATAVMRLVERSLLELDRPVREYLPWLTLPDREASARITLRMLLSHTSGLPPVIGDFSSRELGGLERLCREVVTRFPLFAPPGEIAYYSNPGIDLAGHVMEAVTGTYYPELMRELVFEPLSMERATYDPTVAMTYPLALAHYLEDGEPRVVHRYFENTAGYPAGYAKSTALDLARFASMHLNRGRCGEGQFLTPRSVEELHGVRAETFETPGAGYGLCFHTRHYKGVRLVEGRGAASGFTCELALAPGERTAVVVLANLLVDFPILGIPETLLDELLDLPREAPRPRTVEPDRSRWPLYAGSYLNPVFGLVAVRREGEGLLLDRRGESWELHALGADRYVAWEGPTYVRFVPSGRDGESAAYVQVDGTAYKRAEVDGDRIPDAATLESYAGVYGVSLDDPDRVEVRIEGGRLLIGGPPDLIPVVPIGGGRFVGSNGLWEFLTEGDRVSALRQWDLKMRERIYPSRAPEH